MHIFSRQQTETMSWRVLFNIFYLFNVCLHIWIGGLCSRGGAVVVVGEIFELVSLSLYC